MAWVLLGEQILSRDVPGGETLGKRSVACAVPAPVFNIPLVASILRTNSSHEGQVLILGA